jgi:release factor glutamine methyltransferase
VTLRRVLVKLSATEQRYRTVFGSGRHTGSPSRTMVPVMTYEPRMSAEEAERLRRWHERAYAESRVEGDSGQTFEYLGLILDVPADVMPISRVSRLLGEAIVDEVKPNDRVLDMGTGSGVNAMLAARSAREVVAVDLNPSAVEAARANAARNGVADRVDVRLSDVFESVDGRFDLIIFDPPFRWFAPRDRLEMAMTDENYQALTAFFTEVRKFLTPTGRLLIFFGTSGDLAYLRSLATRAGFATETIATHHVFRETHRVEYYVYRMTLPDG